MKQLENKQFSVSARYRAILSAVPDIIMEVDLNRILTWTNRAGIDFFGESAVGEKTALHESLQTLLDGSDGEIFVETWHQRQDGDKRLLAWQGRTLMDGDDNVTGALCTARDVTDRVNIEQRLRHSQKLEAIGQLAGGVAHDFNNVLTTIGCYSALLSDHVCTTNGFLDDVNEIRKAAERASSLTRQLLAFSHRQVLEPKVINLNKVVDELTKMLRRILGENIEMVTHIEPALGMVEVDPGQMEQVLINLAINARDAMPRDGRLTLETTNIVVDELEASRYAPMPPGNYVKVVVTDTGVGMDPETQAHIFEPFFTTKKNQGTGLGLASVYGIVKQSGGYIWTFSEPGAGTSFQIFLPRVQKVEPPVQTRATRRPPQGYRTVLLVEDDDVVRAVIRKVLAKNGYAVFEAADPEEAMFVSTRQDGPIDLLLTDLIMPKSNGRELANRFMQVREDAQVLYMSGHADETLSQYGILPPVSNLLRKPFTPAVLVRKIREMLGQRP